MWTVADIPSLAGRVAVVTGSTAGIGFATAEALAGRGAHVVLAVRDEARGAEAAARIAGTTTVVHVNLAALESVRRAAAEVTDRFPRIGLLSPRSAGRVRGGGGR